jgi:hypothetical protein
VFPSLSFFTIWKPSLTPRIVPRLRMHAAPLPLTSSWRYFVKHRETLPYSPDSRRKRLIKLLAQFFKETTTPVSEAVTYLPNCVINKFRYLPCNFTYTSGVLDELWTIFVSFRWNLFIFKLHSSVTGLWWPLNDRPFDYLMTLQL